MSFIVKTPLRYPGGKSRALPIIIPQIPKFDEFREPFIGGGSVFLALKQLFPNRMYWINDLNEDLFSFWKILQTKQNELVEKIKEIKSKEKNGKKLFLNFKNYQPKKHFDKALRFFILNRITFSGTIDSGGYSQGAFEGRFTDSSIERLKSAAELLTDVRITNDSYGESLITPGKNVFLFLDPPYLSVKKSKLYGKNGDLHINFDHERFAHFVKKSPHKWLITYDDSEEIRKLFKFSNMYEWELQYGMNNYKKEKAAKGKELLISNYPLTFRKIQQEKLFNFV